MDAKHGIRGSGPHTPADESLLAPSSPPVDESLQPDAGAQSAERHQPIGAYLRRQRELRGISAEELARATRIPLRSLERLEAGRFDGEVDGFVRGFVRTVATALGLDPDETVSRMLAEPTAEELPDFVPSRAMSRAVVGLAAVLVLALAIGIVRIVATTEPVPTRTDDDDVVLRVDPVRSLAEAQAGARTSTPAAVAAPPPERTAASAAKDAQPRP